MTRLRGLRGATTIEQDESAAVKERVQELLLAMVERNALEIDDIVSIIFTATDDIHSAFPATVAREIGFGATPMMCAQELDIENATPLCIRVMMHVNSDSSSPSNHVYLHEAASLRPDLSL